MQVTTLHINIMAQRSTANSNQLGLYATWSAGHRSIHASPSCKDGSYCLQRVKHPLLQPLFEYVCNPTMKMYN